MKLFLVTGQVYFKKEKIKPLVSMRIVRAEDMEGAEDIYANYWERQGLAVRDIHATETLE